MYEILGLKHVFSTFQETVWSHLKFHLAFIWEAGQPAQPRSRFVWPRSRVPGLVIFSYKRDWPGWKIAICACSDTRVCVLIQNGGVINSFCRQNVSEEDARKSHQNNYGQIWNLVFMLNKISHLFALLTCVIQWYTQVNTNTFCISTHVLLSIY